MTPLEGSAPERPVDEFLQVGLAQVILQTRPGDQLTLLRSRIGDEIWLAITRPDTQPNFVRFCSIFV